MYHIANCCRNACKNCCICVDKTCNCACKHCEKCSACIARTFERPFSFCAFLTFFITVLPFFAAINYFVGAEGECDPNVPLHLLIQGINLLLTFFFVCYLSYKYGQEYRPGKPGAAV